LRTGGRLPGDMVDVLVRDLPPLRGRTRGGCAADSPGPGPCPLYSLERKGRSCGRHFPRLNSILKRSLKTEYFNPSESFVCSAESGRILRRF
jgi:hypothetical protein